MSSYPDGMTLRPLQSWPGTLPGEYVRSPFSVPLSATLDELDKELQHLGPSRWSNAPSVLALALRDDDFRVDGMPRASARTAHPGVVLYIESRFGPLSYPAAKFTTWQDNLRAITLALNGLRRLDRYGITDANQQYTGWKALPSSGDGSAHASVEEAQRFLREVTGMPEEPLDRVYRNARALTHPDRAGDTSENRRVWDTVEAAGDTLRRAGMLR